MPPEGAVTPVQHRLGLGWQAVCHATIEVGPGRGVIRAHRHQNRNAGGHRPRDHRTQARPVGFRLAEAIDAHQLRPCIDGGFQQARSLGQRR